LKTLTGHNSAVYSVIELSDRRIVSGSNDKLIRIWDIKLGMYLKILTGHTNYVHSVIELSDERIASGSNDKLIRI
jgi:WD40 repeat protein